MEFKMIIRVHNNHLVTKERDIFQIMYAAMEPEDVVGGFLARNNFTLVPDAYSRALRFTLQLAKRFIWQSAGANYSDLRHHIKKIRRHNHCYDNEHYDALLQLPPSQDLLAYINKHFQYGGYFDAWSDYLLNLLKSQQTASVRRLMRNVNHYTQLINQLAVYYLYDPKRAWRNISNPTLIAHQILKTK